MSVGLIALLDDIATLARSAAVTLDDIAGQAAKAGAKSAGVVIDDAAVTPRYVVGFSADRELPIVAKIARGSLLNKLAILLPAALVLNLLAPWSIVPLLMFGGLFLCYEGSEKVFEAINPDAAHAHEERIQGSVDPLELERQRVNGAIKTDFILSAEIMAIALATVLEASFLSQAIVLVLVALFITVGVYGTVALIVRADDIGLALAGSTTSGWRGSLLRSLGRGLVRSMPGFLRGLAAVGTAAMIWVGGGIIVHGLASFGLTGPEHFIQELARATAEATTPAGGIVAWLVGAAGAGVVGLLLGFALIPAVSRFVVPAWKRLQGLRR